MILPKRDQTFIRRQGFPGGSVVKNPPANAGASCMGSILGLGRAPEGGNGNPPQYFCQDNLKEHVRL